MQETLQTILTFMVFSVLAITLFRHLRLPSMLAYFAIGIALGPQTFGFLEDSPATRDLAEIGLMFLMFSIGLEFSLPQLYAMRKKVLGLGGCQVLFSVMLIGTLAMTFHLDWRAAIVISAALAMSSTAIVSKMLAERAGLGTRHGRGAFGILLFQDIAVVPFLILIPALGSSVNALPMALFSAFIKAAVVLSILLVFGKKLMNSWFSLIAQQRSRELFILNVLMITLLMAYATAHAGLSHSLGAFIAGMLISETHYRYQVESDIAPFRDILLGLFFITVGMMVNLDLLLQHLDWVLLLTVAIILLKTAIITPLAMMFGQQKGSALRTAMILAQAGEFSFVILAHGYKGGLLTNDVLQVTIMAALLSMMVTPFLIQHSGRIAAYLTPSYNKALHKEASAVAQVGDQLSNHAIICGYGRSGQYLARFFNEEGIPFIAIDIDPERIKMAGSSAENVVFGDAARHEVLKAAGAERARILVISYGNFRAIMKVMHAVRGSYPKLPVVVRTLDDTHLEELFTAGASEVVPEVLEGGLMLASHALVKMGVPLSRVMKRVRHFREERYRYFRSFFPGSTDYDQADNLERIQLYSAILPATSYACGKTINELFDLLKKKYQVELQSVRRPNTTLFNHNIIPLTEGDMLVMEGTPRNLADAERFILTGHDD